MKKDRLLKEHNRKETKIKGIELTIILLQIVSIAGALIEEHTSLHTALASYGWSIGETFSSVLLQIMATIATLTIALIALVSNVVEKQFAGVYVSDFYLNIRPWIYKQKRIIFVSLINIACACVLHVLHRYALVFSLSLCEIGLVLVSAQSIYRIFLGKGYYMEELKSFVMETQKDGSGLRSVYRKRLNEAFQGVVSEGKRNEFDEYARLYLDILKDDVIFVLINEEKQYEDIKINFDKIIEDSETLQLVLDAAAGSGSTQSKFFCINLLQESYTELYQIIMEFSDAKKLNLTLLKLFKPLDYKNYRDFMIKIMMGITPEEIEKSNINISELLYKMLVIDFNSSESQSCNTIVPVLCECIAVYLSKEVIKGNTYSINYWGGVFHRLYYTDQSIIFDKTRLPEYKMSIAEVCVTYAYGLIYNGITDIVLQELFIGNELQFYHPAMEQLFVMLAVHLYLYYFCIREDEVYVGAAYRNKIIKEFLENEDYIRIIHKMLANCDADQLDQAIDESHLGVFLRKCDARSRSRSAHIIIVGEVVHDFCVMIRLYLSEQYGKQLFRKMEVNSLYPYFLGADKEKDTKQMILEFVQFMDYGKKDGKELKNLQAMANRMYENLHSYVVREYKKREWEKAKAVQSEYLKSDEQDMVRMMREGVLDYIKTVLQPLLSSAEAPKEEMDEFVALRFETYTETLSENTLIHFQNEIACVIFDEFARVLQKRHVLRKLDRDSEFIDDYAYMKQLKDDALEVLAGSEYLLRNKDWRVSEDFREFIKDSVTVFLTGCRYGVAMKKNVAHIRLIDLEVVIRSPDLEERSMIQDGRYQYEPVEGLSLTYDKDELKEYIGNRRKTVIVKVKMAVQWHTEDGGILFQNECF